MNVSADNLLLIVGIALIVLWCLCYLLNPFKWAFLMEAKGDYAGADAITARRQAARSKKQKAKS